MKMIAALTLLTVSLVVPALPVAGGDVIDARVFPPAAFAPTDLVVRAFIERDDRNRYVEFVIDSEAMFASSTVELDGDRAPRTRDVRFRRLPAGIYEVRVTVMGTHGMRGSVVRRFSVY